MQTHHSHTNALRPASVYVSAATEAFISSLMQTHTHIYTSTRSKKHFMSLPSPVSHQLHRHWCCPDTQLSLSPERNKIPHMAGLQQIWYAAAAAAASLALTLTDIIRDYHLLVLLCLAVTVQKQTVFPEWLINSCSLITTMESLGTAVLIYALKKCTWNTQ